MTTSLAQQLNALKLQQKDALQTPKHARISFLFDSKQASNIDDQTLYYICKAGVKQLKDSQQLDLTIFENDILNEKSLTFYRGTETKQTLELIDQQVDQLVRVLAPFLLDQSALKVIEYLVRIYEVHIFHKQTLLLAFLPLFETVYFLRITQCLNLKDDQVWGWLFQFAYQGISIDKETLVKCIARQNGLVFCLAAKFCFEVKGDLHIKYFGVFLCEVLKANSQEGLMFGVLPFISQGLKQSDSKNLRVACLLALGQLACRRTLTKEYAGAFVRQILQMIIAKDRLEFDEDIKIKALTTILFLTQYQNVVFERKDFEYLLKIQKIAKLLQVLSKQFDTSHLALSILQGALNIAEIAHSDTAKLLAPLCNLKTVFVLVQNLCLRTTGDETSINQTRTYIEILRELAPDMFHQSIQYLLKQQNDPQSRESIVQLLQGNKLSNLIVNFGDKEYSILAALSSQRKQSQEAALKTLNEESFVKVLSEKEVFLVRMTLLQQVGSACLEETHMLQVLHALRRVGGDLSDSDFEIVMSLLNRISAKQVTYSKQVLECCITMLCSIKTINGQTQKVQAWLAFQHKTELSTQNLYSDLVTSKKTQNSKPADQIDLLVAKFVEKPQKAIQFVLGIFQTHHSAVDFSLVAKVLKKLGVSVQKDLIASTIAEQLICPILSIMKKQNFKYSHEILASILDGLSVEMITSESKVISKLIGVALVQKQWQEKNFDLLSLLSKFCSDKTKFVEIMINIALISSCLIKRTFSIQMLISIHQKGNQKFQLYSQISYKIMIGVVLMLLNDSQKVIREFATRLADVMLETQKQASKDTTLALIEVFGDTDKPQSASKRQERLTPMKSKTVTTLLEDLIEYRADLVIDKSQLQQVLTKHQKPEVFEEILRTLLDYPSFHLKQKLLEVLAQPQKHAIIFCMNLAQVLQKLFIQVDSKILNQNYLAALGNLIAHLQDTQPRAAQKEIFSSLTLPYLKFISDKPNLGDLVYKTFQTSVLITDVLKDAEQKHLREVFKVYIRSRPSTKLRLLFIQQAQATFKSEDLALCLDEKQEDLEIVLETIIQLAPQQSAKLFTQTTKILSTQITRFLQNEDVAYLIELCCQLAQSCVSLKNAGFQQDFVQIQELSKKVWKHTQKQTQIGLLKNGDRTVDPFDEFMKDEEINSEQSDAEEIDLLPCLQVLTSLFNLLTPLEYTEKVPIFTTNLLAEVADYLEQICSVKSSAASLQSSIKSQLYYLYQSLVLRTTQRLSDNADYSRLVIKYLECSVNLIDNGRMSKVLGQGSQVLNTIKSLPQYSSLISYTLIWLASTSKVDIDDQNLIKVDFQSGAALFLCQETLLWAIDNHQDISPIRDLIFNVQYTIVDKEKFTEIDQLTEDLFGFELKEKLKQENCLKIANSASSKTKRKFIYLFGTMLNQWLTKNQSFVAKISAIAGVEQPDDEVQKQILHMLLSSYLIREQIQQLLQEESSQSLTRLQNCINKLQQTLNEMMSMQIHIQTVMQILDMNPQPLKVNTLCLLLEKIDSFSSGWMAKCSSSLQKTFETLIEKCTIMLQSGNNTETLSQLLLTVLSATASDQLSKEIKTKTLEITMKYHKGSLQLQTQTILTEMRLMEIYTYQMLDHFHLYLEHTLEGFNVKEQIFVDTYRHALLKSLVCISQVFLKFLSADQLEKVITLAIMSVAKGHIKSYSGDSVEIILESIASETAQHKKLILQATMNTLSILTKQLESENFDSLSLRYFQQLLCPVIRRLPQSYISEHNQKFVVFFKQVFKLPIKVQSCSTLVVESFNAFILKLNEDTLRPIVLKFEKWAEKESNRKLIFYQVLCGCLQTLREFFVPFFKTYFEQIFQSLKDCFKNINVGKQGKRLHDGTEPDQAFNLLTEVCKLIELNYKFDTNSFLQNDTFEALCDPIADLFDLFTLKNFDYFVNNTLKPLVLEMDERSNDDTMWQKLNLALLMKTRSEHWETRLAVLQVIEHMFDKMRERYLVILNDTIPFISELLEDENERVEQVAKRIVNRIENLTGESITEYLK